MAVLAFLVAIVQHGLLGDVEWGIILSKTYRDLQSIAATVYGGEDVP